jgi:hypothetical protein
MAEKRTEITHFLLEQAKKLRALAEPYRPEISDELLALATAWEERARRADPQS